MKLRAEDSEWTSRDAVYWVVLGGRKHAVLMDMPPLPRDPTETSNLEIELQEYWIESQTSWSQQ